MIACRRLTCEMLYAMPPKPATSVPTMRTGTGKLFGASGNASPETENTTAVSQIAGPTPTAFWRRVVVSAPRIEPTPKPAKTAPAQNDEMCSVRAM